MDHTRSAVQWNCRSVGSKKSEIIYLINKFNPFIFAITETWLKPGSVFKLSGFSCLRDDRPDGWGGAALLIKNSCSFSQCSLPSHDANNFNVVACLVNKICFVSLYIPHPSSQTFLEIENLLTCLPEPFIVMGDFNAHHRAWGSSISNTHGKDLINIISRLNLCILNDGSQTRLTKPSENASVVDLTITSPSLAIDIIWKTHKFTHGSDHFPIILQFTKFKVKNIPKAPPRMRHRIIPDKWSDFKSYIENNISSLPLTGYPSCANSFINIILD